MSCFVKSLLVALLLFPLVPVLTFSQTTNTIVIEGIDLMPQGRASDGRGIMTDAAIEAVKRAGFTGKLEFLPWKRAQAKVTDGKNLLITALSRTPEREDKYVWLFPVFRYERAFITTGKTYSSFAEAKASLKHIIATLGSAQYDILIREGFSPNQITTVEIERQNVIPSMLLAGHGDAWFAVTAEARFSLKGEAEVAKFVIGPSLGQGTDQFVAASKDSSPELIEKLKKAGAQMAADGTIAKIIKQYQ